MSDSSEGIESRNFYENSDGEGSANSSHASSLASHLQGRPKRQRPAQIVGKAWVLHGEITINQSLSDSFDAKVQNTKSQLQATLGAKFETLFEKMCSEVSYFVIFCNLFNILHDAPAETKVKIQIRGFLQLGKSKAKTGLDKLLSGDGDDDRTAGRRFTRIAYNQRWLSLEQKPVPSEKTSITFMI